MLSRKCRFALAAALASLLSIASPAGAAAPEKGKIAEAKDSAKKDSAKKAKKDDAKKKDDVKKDDAKKAKKDDVKKDDARKADAAVKGPASIGAPNSGRLKGAIKLHSSRSLKLREKANAWGLPALVKLLQRAAGKVAKHHAKSVMLVGDLSQKAGGALTGHNSHQTGRDADVGFYIANSKGKAAVLKHFVAFDGAGKSTQVAWAQFDDARNWALVEALLTDKDTAVRYIFVSTPLRARVLAYAAKKKVAKDLYARAESVLLSPRDADVHDDHFHVRIVCPEAMKGTCIEEPRAPSN
jgi:penicillin-insensitive murein DD-endopeptidase